MGKPTVATYTPTMEIFSDHTYLARSSNEFIKMIELALHENDSNLSIKRETFAKSHTWEKCIENFWQVINY